MKVIICEPNVPPYVQSILGNYQQIKELIGNEVKALSTNNPNIVIMCNQERLSKERNLDENRLNIPGLFLFVGRDHDRLRSLTEGEINEIIDTIRKEDLTVVH